MHESTVSRSTRNKVIQTPIGLFEMNQLFSAKLKANDTGYASSNQVKLFLKQLIQQENPKKPLSDQKLAENLLQQKGITISRRTVAKYREELNIFSSAKRK
jgi:RNA polymerase sigma-54 factor